MTEATHSPYISLKQAAAIASILVAVVGGGVAVNSHIHLAIESHRMHGEHPDAVSDELFAQFTSNQLRWQASLDKRLHRIEQKLDGMEVISR